MQATQSSTASGIECRIQQFAAFRFISRHLERDASWPSIEFSGKVLAGSGLARERLKGADGEAVGDRPEWVEGALSWVAAKLLREIQLRHSRLAEEVISQEERMRCLAELGSLREESCALLNCFLRQPHGVNRLYVLESGDGGGIAC